MSRITGVSELDDVLLRVKAAKDRDEYDTTMRDLFAIAPNYIEEISRLYDSDTYHKQPLIWCLIGQTSKPAMKLFSKAINDKDQYTRWAASEALSRFKTLEASKLLVESLKDRSHLVKGIAVRSMSKFRNPDAIPQLEKISASKYLQNSAPGIVKDARKALQYCKNSPDKRMQTDLPTAVR